MKEHKIHFTSWPRDLNLSVGETDNEMMIKKLSYGPLTMVKTWQAYDINGFTFYTKAKDKKCQHQNSGVRADAEDSTGQKNAYYGYIEEIWVLDYGNSVEIPVFKCQWVKQPEVVEVNDYGFTIVDLNKVGYKDDPWVLAVIARI